MYQLVLVRHGQSEWNALNQFTGWTDVELTKKGREEAQAAGKLLFSKGFQFDVAYTSVLKRAIHTLDIILDEVDQVWLPVQKHWQLNERHYGALQGFNKKEMAEKVGAEQVHIWRRSYGTPPPALEKDDPRWARKDPRYAELSDAQIPLCESLADNVKRMEPFIAETILPTIKSGKKVLISAHGNSLRALVKYLDQLSDEEIVGFEIPTGKPILYKLDENLKPISREFLDL